MNRRVTPGSDPVFFDPSGRRRRVINRATLAIGVATGFAAVIFVLSLLAAPFVTQPGLTGQPARLQQGRSGSLIAPRRARLSRHFIQQARAALAREIAADRPVPPGAADTIVAAFYVTWQQNGRNQLIANADKLTHLMPEWMHLARDGSGLDLRDWDPVVTPMNTEVVQIANAHGIDILPILNNAEARAFDPERAALMLRSPERRRAVAFKVRDFLVGNGFDGVNVDFESLHEEDYARLPAFLAELKSVLPESLLVTVDVEARLAPEMVARLAHSADFVVLMAYAQTGTGEEPGPLAAVPWYDSILTRLAAAVPRGKLVVGVGSYGIDWTRGLGGVPITVERAWEAAKDHREGETPQQVVDFDDVALNPTYVYRGDTTDAHEVWFLDAACVYNQLRLVQRHGAIGTALWVLGAEDPSLWAIYDRRHRGSLPHPSVLDTVHAPGGLTYTSDEGEILSVAALPKDGLRHTDLDSVTGLITDESYLDYPQSFVVRRQGYHAGLLALTFDDGPDDRWTDMILDSLAELGVPGTFFLVGQNVEKYPDVVRRIVEGGHEVGNHTFTHPNMAVTRRRRAILELNATQRVLEAVTGRSTTLFRIPYNTDAEPQNGDEAGPLVLASSLGYVTVGEQIDPQDWRLFDFDANGVRQPRSRGAIADTTVAQAHSVHGNVILLHSAGGDRSATVEAVPQIVRRLEAQGYRFVTVSTLLNTTFDAVMPKVTARDLVLVGFDKATFELLDVAEMLLTAGFLSALVLALLRVMLVVPLALAARRGTRRLVFDPAWRPPITIMIAAYNEATVIERTVRAALASTWPDLDIIVVDDGSTDGTGAVVEAAFAGEPRVRLLRQANAGKAAALNLAIAAARHEVLVGFDADTQVEAGAVAQLVRHFADPAVVAVAGNVKVGNRMNALTIWQSIEYITSQNLDRRAFSWLNGVLVVPGAIGAWRRSAVLAVGGYVSDTLAEDMDLTFRLRRAGGRIASDAEAVGWTEAPETFQGFLLQRFRWTYGSLQVLWKHRGALGRHGWFGRLVLPAQWLFSVVFQIVGPIVDLRLLYAVLAVAFSYFATHQDFQPLPQLARILAQTGFFYGLFFAVELAAAIVAVRLDEEDMKQLWWMFWQRFVYRQTMYYILWKAVVGAVKGKEFGWGKVQRTGTVRQAGAAPI